MRLPEICCDTCPYNPTCEDERDFLKDVFHLDDDGELDRDTFNL